MKSEAILGLSILLVLIIAWNVVSAPDRFVWFSGPVTAVVVLAVSAAVGFMLGLFVALVPRRDDRARRSVR